MCECENEKGEQGRGEEDLPVSEVDQGFIQSCANLSCVCEGPWDWVAVPCYPVTPDNRPTARPQGNMRGGNLEGERGRERERATRGRGGGCEWRCVRDAKLAQLLQMTG